MILAKIQQDLKAALKAHDVLRVSTLRFLLAAVHNRKIEKQSALTDDDILAVIRQQTKQHRESIAAYQQGKRDDLVAKEQAELDLLSKYLPQQMSAEELAKIVKSTLAEMGGSPPAGGADFGKAMGAVMGRVKGLADGNQVAAVVKSQLSLT